MHLRTSPRAPSFSVALAALVSLVGMALVGCGRKEAAQGWSGGERGDRPVAVTTTMLRRLERQPAGDLGPLK